jgi:hypothetical protein
LVGKDGFKNSQKVVFVSFKREKKIIAVHGAATKLER